MTDSDAHKIHALVSKHCGEHTAAQAARLLGFARYGRPMYVNGTNLKRALEIFRRLERDPSFSLDHYLASLMPKNLPRDGDDKIKTKWSTYISSEIQEDYKNTFKVDGLRPLSES